MRSVELAWISKTVLDDNIGNPSLLHKKQFILNFFILLKSTNTKKQLLIFKAQNELFGKYMYIYNFNNIQRGQKRNITTTERRQQKGNMITKWRKNHLNLMLTIFKLLS